MLLVVAATEIEMKALYGASRRGLRKTLHLIAGVGLLETAVTLTRFLDKHHRQINGVVNFGVGGGYPDQSKKQVKILDICLAEREVLGDYGVCFGEATESFSDRSLMGKTTFELDTRLLERAISLLAEAGLACSRGVFVTVNGSSGTAARGELLRNRFKAICENMEGAAVARVCQEFDLPLLEVRALSNLVEDRPGTPWLLQEACQRAAEAAACIIAGFEEEP